MQVCRSFGTPTPHVSPQPARCTSPVVLPPTVRTSSPPTPAPSPPSKALHAISPIDGRYHAQTAELTPYFSEVAQMRYRVGVEVEYLLALAAVLQDSRPDFAADVQNQAPALRRLPVEFSDRDAERVKELEAITHHDVKAVEYWLKEQLETLGLGRHAEMVHFALTSQDINNTAQPLALKACLHDVLLPHLRAVENALRELGIGCLDQPMLARTHGQPATPVWMGKEMLVFVERLVRQRRVVEEVQLLAKVGGATGQFNAHVAAYPQVDWPQFADRFVAALGLHRSQFTTQIGHYDDIAEVMHGLARCNTVLIDACRDMWQYIAMGYFRLRTAPGEVGSSTMPHKVNPIEFENAEGNLQQANFILEGMAGKLPISRLQRDLTDSTVLRNVGVALGHTLVALKSLQRGMAKLQVDDAAVAADLLAHPEVVSEGMQTVLRRADYPRPYEALKDLTRGSRVDAAGLAAFVDGLDVAPEVKAELHALQPQSYLGTLPAATPRARPGVALVTGNAGKVRELRALLPDMPVRSLAVDLPEIQALRCGEVVRAKLAAARAAVPATDNAIVVVEDSGLAVGTPDGFPGALAKFQLQSHSLAQIVRMAEAGHGAAPPAFAQCALGWWDPVTDAQQVVETQVPGHLVPPRGTEGFGWDPIFVPDGAQETLAEMPLCRKLQHSPRAAAVRRMSELQGLVAVL